MRASDGDHDWLVAHGRELPPDKYPVRFVTMNEQMMVGLWLMDRLHEYARSIGCITYEDGLLHAYPVVTQR